MTMNAGSVRASSGLMVGLVICLIVLPGCGDGGGDGVDVPVFTLPSTITLLSEDFSSGNLSNWTIQAPAVQASVYGNPAPSLLLDGLAGTSSQAIVYSNSSFLTSGGLTLSADVDPGNSNATVDIIDTPNPAMIDTFASIVGTQVLYSIGGISKLISHVPDGKYHRFTFTVMNYGIASWSRDGVVEQLAPFSAPITVQLDLRDLAAGNSGSRFDNVTVTVP